jgi:hypothetical protein
MRIPRGYTPPPMKVRRTAQPDRSARTRTRLGAFLASVLASAFASALACAADIEVRIVHYGAADLFRAAGPVAVQAEFRSALDRPVELEVAWEVANADLDIAEHARSFVLNPGQAQRRWLYANLPPMGEGSLGLEVFDLRLYERAGGERVRDLGTTRIAPSIAENTPRILGLNEDAIAVVGARAAGLDAFSLSPVQGESLPSMNTTTAIGFIRDAESFPDRWEGYAILDAVVWSSGAIPPSRLSEDSARALLQWVERGGNLVIALPAAGDPWSIGSPGRHALSELLPSVAPTRVDDVRMRDILPALSVSGTLRSDAAKTRIGVFDPEKLDRGWRPFLAMPARKNPAGVPTMPEGTVDGMIDARVFGVRRSLGHGFVTVVGVDVDELAASGLQVPALPNGDVFWNRILGRRADTPSGAELAALADKGRLVSGARGYTRSIGDGEQVADAIDLPGAAAVSVLAATGVFALYWLVAGPLGFALLRGAKRERWSWVVFVLVAIGFTILIWSVGSAFTDRKPGLRHVTVLDHVARAQGESDPTARELRRATSWMSVLVPKYGSATVELDPESDPSLRNSLVSWRAISRDPLGFPSRERSVLPLDAPNRVDAPARSTAIDLEARWLGGLDPKWGRMPEVATPVEVKIDRSTTPAEISLVGSLRHALPGPLTDVTVVHIWPQRNPLVSLGTDAPPTRRAPGQLPNRGQMYVLSESWAPGVELDLGRIVGPSPLFGQASLQETLRERHYRSIYRSASQFGTGFGLAEQALGLERSFEMLSLYSMLTPPEYLQNPPSEPEVLRITRSDMRELDLSRHLAEPCLIVMGWLDGPAIPFPMRLDGEPIPSSGRTLVRWILPLPAETSWIVPDRAGPAPK